MYVFTVAQWEAWHGSELLGIFAQLDDARRFAEGYKNVVDRISGEGLDKFEDDDIHDWVEITQVELQ